MPKPTYISFSADALNALLPPLKGVITFKDSNNSNLSLYVTATGAKSFFLRKRIHGRDQRIILGSYPKVSIAEARKLASVHASSVALGQHQAVEGYKERQNRMFGKQCEIYLEEHCKAKNRSHKQREQQIKLYLSSLAKYRLPAITREGVGILHKRVAMQSGETTANRVAELIRAIYNHAIKHGYEGKNPASSFEKFRETKRDRFVQPDEMPFLLEALSAEKCQQTKDLFMILLLTGVRRKNALEMRYEHINWQFKYWRIPDTKNGEPHIVPLLDEVMYILRERQKQSSNPWVFPQQDNPDKPSNNPQKAWERIIAGATLLKWTHQDGLKSLIKEVTLSIPAYFRYGPVFIHKLVVEKAAVRRVKLPRDMLDLRIHDLRRTFGSYQALTGANLSVIGKSLGHKSLAATQIYARLELDAVRRSVEKATVTMLGSV